MDNASLQPVVSELVSKPGHEKVRTLLHKLLTDGLGAESTSIDFEKQVPEVRGRIDALLGRTVFEFKSDLKRESNEAIAQLGRYLPERERATGLRFLGVATDGATFRAYEFREDAVLSGSHMAPIGEVLDGMRAVGLDEVTVVVGGIIPEADAAALKAKGVARVYTPKDFELNRIMADIVALVGEASREAA